MIDLLDNENLVIVEDGSEIKMYFSRTAKLSNSGLKIKPNNDEGGF
jgi:hypothetical protein